MSRTDRRREGGGPSASPDDPPAGRLVVPADVELIDPIGGTVVTIGELADDPLTVILVRYFGCLPCQQYLVAVDRQIERFPGTVVAVGGSADYQARWLYEKKRVRLPLLLDPDQVVRRAVDLADLTPMELAAGRGLLAYAKAMTAGFRPQAPTRDAGRSPGIAVFGPDLDVRWVHRGSALGAYPDIEDLVSRVGGLP